MLLLISGSVIATLNDDTNFQFRNKWEIFPAEYTSTRGYADVDEQLTVGITAATSSGARNNIRTLYTLQQDVADWKQNQRQPVTVHYTPEGSNTTYRTLLTDLKLTLPSDIHLIDSYRGIPNATIEYTRKGLWLSGSEGYYQSTSGVSGRVVTITGLSTQYAYAPTDFSISGFVTSITASDDFPQGYIFVADRTISSRPAIVAEPASGMFGSTVTVGNASVARDSTSAAIDNFYGLRPSAMQMLNAYEKVHVYIHGSVDMPFSAVLQVTADAPITVNTEYINITDPIYYSSLSLYPAYMGTINRSPNFSFTDLRILIESETGAVIDVYQILFVAETDGTNIIQIMPGENFGFVSNARSNGRYEGQVRSNYLTHYATIWNKQIGVTGAGVMASGTLTYDGAVGDIYMQTKSSTVDTMVLFTAGSLATSWWYLPNTAANAAAQFLRLGLRRDKASLIPGI